MSGQLGSLVVSLEANVAKFNSDMGKAAQQTEQAMQRMQRSADTAKSALIGLAQGAVSALSVSMFVNVIKGSIDAADNLRDLSKTTGIAVEQLAGLKLASQQSGADLESVASSINKLSVNMGKDAEKFAKLGVTAKDPLEAFKQLADVFAAIDDPQTRAALGSEALGKSWAQVAPLLSEGGKSIGEMVEKGTRLSGITKKMTDDADQFNDQLTELQTAAAGAASKLAGEMVPALTSVANAMKQAYEDSGKLTAAWVGLGAVGAFLFTDEFASNKVKLEGVNKELRNLYAVQQDMKGAGSVMQFVYGDNAKRDEQIKQLESQKAALEKAMQPPVATKSPDAPKPSDELDMRVCVFGGGVWRNGRCEPKPAAAAAAKTDPTVALLDGLKKEYESLTGAASKYAEVERAMAAMKEKVAPARRAEIENLARMIDFQKDEAENDKFIAEARAEFAKSTEDLLTISRDYAQVVLENNGLAQFELTLMGKTAEERQVAIEQFKIQVELERKIRDIRKLRGTEAETTAAIDAVTKTAGSEKDGVKTRAFLDEQQRIADKSQQIWDNFSENVQRNLGDGLYDAMRGNFDNIGDAFLSMIQRMVADAAAAKLMEALVGKKGGSDGDGLIGAFLKTGLSMITRSPSTPAYTPGMNPGAGANGFVNWSGFSAADGFDVPAGMDPMTQLHEREMVLPKEHADVIRGLASGGARGGITVNITNTSGAKVETRPSVDGSGGIDVLISAIEDRMAGNVAYGTGSLNSALQSRYGLSPAVG